MKDQNQEEVIDIVNMIKTIWGNRKVIIYSILVFLFLAIITIIFSPIKYKVSATLLPSAEKQSSNMGGLSALAGMAGVNIGSMMGGSSTIPSEVYPQVVSSYPFLNELVNRKFHFEDYDNPISILKYIEGDTIDSFTDKLLKFTIKLPWTIKEGLKRPEEDGYTNNYGLIKLSKKEKRTLEFVKDLIKIEVDSKTGIVSLTVESSEPVLTAQFVQKSIDLLQEYVIKYKTKQAQENLKFVQDSYNEKKAEYEKLQKELYRYLDSHRNLISERHDIEYQRLSDSYELASTIYNELAKQLEQAKIAVKEETPAFTIIEPARIPNEKSAPRKFIIIVVSVFLGFTMGIAIIFGKIVLDNIKQRYSY